MSSLEINSKMENNREIVFLMDSCPGIQYKFIEKCDNGLWNEGKKFELGWRMDLTLQPYEIKTIRYKVPYLPLRNTEENFRKLKELDYDVKLEELTDMWNALLDKGSRFFVPGTPYGDLWKAQTAATFILVDRQNKGSSKLFGREMYKKWANGNYPDKVLDYMHLSPTLYEFIWAQEAAYWVLGMLDMQGYHGEVEECLELFFELQGKGTPGLHDCSILPERNYASPYMGTTPHAWLNSNGGVLLAIAEHYKLTRNKEWITDHKQSILSACNWIKELRISTKNEKFKNGYGLMPPGQSTDATFASDHLQWYYTDIWTILGLESIARVLKECEIISANDLLNEAEDYKACFLRSLDQSIISIDEFKDKESDYDFSVYKYSGPLHNDKITEWDENGVPLKLKGRVYSRKEAAEEKGIKIYVPMSPQANIPFKMPYLDNAFCYALGFLSGIIDYSSDRPIFNGARYSGKDIWQGIMDYCKLTDQLDIEHGVFSRGLPYNEYLIKKFLDCDENDYFHAAVSFVLRYGCEMETYMAKETAGAYLKEMWFQPCPFALSMATIRKWLRNMLIYEDENSRRLVIGKALPKEWIENTATFEEPLFIERASSYFGPVSVSYGMNFICSKLTIRIELHDVKRFPGEVEVRFLNPCDYSVVKVLMNGIPLDKFTTKASFVVIVPQKDCPDGRMNIEVLFQT